MRAAVPRAEGETQAAILGADGRLEASKRDAQAQIVLADGSAKSIQLVSEAIGRENELPVMYLLGEKYVEAISEVSASDNAKMVLYPADLMKTVQGLLNRG